MPTRATGTPSRSTPVLKITSVQQTTSPSGDTYCTKYARKRWFRFEDNHRKMIICRNNVLVSVLKMMSQGKNSRNHAYITMQRKVESKHEMYSIKAHH
jgi:hypothetical protein